MTRIEVVGVVSFTTGMPLVEFSLELPDEKTAEFQVPVMEARDLAQTINEAASNAVYEAALVAWAKDRDPVDGQIMGAHLIGSVREFRADRWGLPDKPDDYKVE